MGWRASQKLIHRWKIVSGDNVIVTRGKDRGGTGVVKHVIHSQYHSIIGGKCVKKHIKQGQGHEGGILQLKPPFMSQMFRFFDPVTGRPCKVGIRYLEDGYQSKSFPRNWNIRVYNSSLRDFKNKSLQPYIT
ncbi:unnamed protein product [Camellia sinensis]